METKNRVKMLTKTRQEMARRFKLLYRSYRNKKFGEPIPQSLLKKKSNQQRDPFELDFGNSYHYGSEKVEDYYFREDAEMIARI